MPAVAPWLKEVLPPPPPLLLPLTVSPEKTRSTLTALAPSSESQAHCWLLREPAMLLGAARI